MIETNKEEFETTEDVFDALGAILIDLSDGEKTENDINSLCTTFFNILQGLVNILANL